MTYIAPFSPIQQQAQTGVAALKTPEQIQAGSQLAGASGLGSLDLAGQAAGAGQQYAQMATRPKCYAVLHVPIHAKRGGLSEITGVT
jgi:hypothetical protein